MTTLRTLECLVALVDHQSFSDAASALHMSQPALSHQIASFEKEIGAPVVERLWRGVRVTAAGRAAADEAKMAIGAAAHAIRMGRRAGRGVAGRLRISCAETMSAWLLAPVIRQWRSRRPDVRIDLWEFTDCEAMLELLDSGCIDVAIGPELMGTEVHAEVVGREEIVVVAAAEHRFAQLTAVCIQDVVSEPFIHYAAGSGLAIWLDRLAADHEIVLDPVLRTHSPWAAAHLAAEGMGVAIVPVSAVAARGSRVVRPLRPALERDVIAIVAAPSDTLVQQFLADIHRRGLPNRDGPG
jgi:DNA-binding transcriptional LysR family regulator